MPNDIHGTHAELFSAVDQAQGERVGSVDDLRHQGADGLEHSGEKGSGNAAFGELFQYRAAANEPVSERQAGFPGALGSGVPTSLTDEPRLGREKFIQGDRSPDRSFSSGPAQFVASSTASRKGLDRSIRQLISRPTHSGFGWER